MQNQPTEQTAAMTKKTTTYLWWQRGIVYQVYPRSFIDSNGDGVGDLTGLISRLDYLRWLGVDAVWISPIYPSPMKDFGYDVADYTAIHPLFGTLADFDRLIGEAHARAGSAERAAEVYERGIAAAREAGDIQAANEMEVFLKRLRKARPG